ncbi:right-handed parallel beta-helix repeat-containing protein, partial [Chelativorans oligotrophicus]|uniref:right-handed parallel beta-helix repeat-containing protein n=1 Tax=Chelativorans oligotrophicus TaxID=449974 RepID=UPI0031B5EBAF
MSVDGIGSNTSPVGTVQAVIPVGSTILRAYLYSTSRSSPSTLAEFNSEGITLAGQSVTFTHLISNSTAWNFFVARADVTSLVRTLTANATTSNFNWTVTEGARNANIDGEVLAIVYSHPNLPPASVAFFDGGLSTTGETAVMSLGAAAMNPASAAFRGELGVAISFSCCNQLSTISINGSTISNFAGNFDDGLSQANGALITVGGVGDPAVSNPANYDSDHELYDLRSYIRTGDRSVTIFAQNPTNDDNLFFIHAYVRTAGIRGTVFEDTAGNLLADGSIGTARNRGISGVTVRLFDNAGTQIGATQTEADGTYLFPSVPAPGTYYVAVDAPTVSAAGTSGVVGEQTYARAGSGNTGAAGGAGYGTLCVSTNGSYTQQNATTTSGAAGNPANGACYGGRRGATADSGTTALNFKEHVIRVVTDAGSPVTNVDFGFSFNVVTNVNDSGQGSVRQFIANANAITAASGGGGEPDAGANVLRFVPALAMNGSDWWQVAPTAPLPAIGGPRTTIDGRAYDNANGTSALLRGAVGTGGLVGADWNPLVLSQVASPKLALANGLTADALTIAAGANDTTIQNLGVFGTTASAGGGIAKTATGTITGLLVRGNVLGVLPNGGAAAGTLQFGLQIANTANGRFEISNNYIEGPREAGILVDSVTHTTPGNYIISNNEVADTGSDGIQLPGSSRVSLQGNLVARSGMVGIELWENGGNNLLTQNTVTDGRGTGAEGAGVRLTLGSNNTVTFNKLEGNTGGPGILQRNTSMGNLLSRNQFGGNAGVAIDNTPGDAPDGVTVSSACAVNGTQLGRPVLSSAILVDNTLRLEGSYCGTGTYRLELYKVAPGSTGDMGADGLQAGEGGTFLAALTGLSGGTLDETLSPAPGNLIAGSDHLTAILIRETATGGAVGDTSEFSANVLVVSVPFVTLAKVSVGGTGSFIFNGSAANANGFPTDDTYSLATTAQDVAVEGAPVPLAAADVATEIVEGVPPGWVLETARCEDRRAATTGNPVGPVIG